VRREFPRKVKALAFQRSGGRCEKCTARLMPGRIIYDHIIPDAIGGEPTLENCQVVCSTCDKPKTAQDAGNLARALRREAAFIGAKAPSRNPLPGGRRSALKRKMNGQVVPRSQPSHDH
jgi:5-methylcytosine-specific restriction protein A